MVIMAAKLGKTRQGVITRKEFLTFKPKFSKGMQFDLYQSNKKNYNYDTYKNLSCKQKLN